MRTREARGALARDDVGPARSRLPQCYRRRSTRSITRDRSRTPRSRSRGPRRRRPRRRRRPAAAGAAPRRTSESTREARDRTADHEQRDRRPGSATSSSVVGAEQVRQQRHERPTANVTNDSSPATYGEGCSSGSTPSSSRTWTRHSLVGVVGQLARRPGPRARGTGRGGGRSPRARPPRPAGRARSQPLLVRSRPGPAGSGTAPTSTRRPPSRTPCQQAAKPLRITVCADALRAGDAGDQRAVGHHAVHRAEDRRPQPATVDVPVGVVDLGFGGTAAPRQRAVIGSCTSSVCPAHASAGSAPSRASASSRVVGGRATHEVRRPPR